MTVYIDIPLPENERGHEWKRYSMQGLRFIACKRCGFLRGLNGPSSDCKGDVRVELRRKKGD